METIVMKTEMFDIGTPRRGKVRDIYDLGDHLLLVVTDRTSAFDVVLPNGIPGKGKVLTQVSVFWFKQKRQEKIMKRKINKTFLNMSSKNIERASCLLLIITIVMLFAGCHVFWKPSDAEAQRLVRSHYLFYGGKVVDTEIIERGEFIRKCKCYPIKFRIIVPDQESFEKTFYFFKNEAGDVEVSEYKFGIKK